MALPSDGIESGLGTSEFILTAIVTVLGAVGTVLSQVYTENVPEWARITGIISSTLMTIVPTIFYAKYRTLRKNSGTPEAGE